MTFYVYSTLTCDNNFAVYSNTPNQDIPVIHKTILIKGGHRVATKSLYTPRGVVTEISDDDMEILLKDYHFIDQVKHGFITYEKKHVDPEKRAKEMTDKDGSSPKTSDDYKKGEDSINGTPMYKTSTGKGKK